MIKKDQSAKKKSHSLSASPEKGNDEEDKFYVDKYQADMRKQTEQEMKKCGYIIGSG